MIRNKLSFYQINTLKLNLKYLNLNIFQKLVKI